MQAKDYLIAAANGVIDTGRGLVGIADLATNDRAGQALTKMGYNPQAAKVILTQQGSPEYQQGRSAIDAQNGMANTAKAYYDNPNMIAPDVMQAVPQFMGGRGIGLGLSAAKRGIKNAGDLSKIGSVINQPAAQLTHTSIGDAMLSAGRYQDAAQQQNGQTTLTDNANALVNGAATGVANRFAGGLLNKAKLPAVQELSPVNVQSPLELKQRP